LKARGARPRRPCLTGRTFLRVQPFGFDPGLEAGGPATNRPRDAKTPHVVDQPSSAHLRSVVKGARAVAAHERRPVRDEQLGLI
jgi:hypothetical protein